MAGRPRKTPAAALLPAPAPIEAEGLRLLTSEDVLAAAPLLQEVYRVGIAKSILEYVKKGQFIETAVQAAGCTTDAYYAAMRIARQPKAPEGVSEQQWTFLRKLHVDIEQADALGEIRLVDQILSSNSSVTILDYMARRFPRRFKQAERGEKTNTTVNIMNNNMPVNAMTREQVIEALAKVGVQPIKKGHQ